MRRTLSITALTLLLGSCGGGDDESRCADLTAKLQSCTPEAQIPSTATCSQGALDNYEQLMEMPCHQFTEVGKADGNHNWDPKVPWNSCRAPCMVSGSWVHCVPNQFTNSANPMENMRHCCHTDAYYSVTVPFCQKIKDHSGHGYGYGNQGFDPSCQGNPLLCQQLSPQMKCRWVAELSDMRCRSGYSSSNAQGYDMPCRNNPSICHLYGLVCQNVGNFMEEMRCRPNHVQHDTQPPLSGSSVCGAGIQATCYNNWAINCENSVVKKESCGLSSCQIQQQSTFYGTRERAVCRGYSSSYDYGGYLGGNPVAPSYNPSPLGVGGSCYPGNGRAYTCVDVTKPLLPSGGQNPCFNAWPGDPSIVVGKCPQGDYRVRCCLRLPRHGFGMADEVGTGETSGEEADTDTTGGCSVSATPAAGAPGMLLMLLVLGLWTRRPQP